MSEQGNDHRVLLHKNYFGYKDAYDAAIDVVEAMEKLEGEYERIVTIVITYENYLTKEAE